ncbi:MAG TPA: hypothetical protein VGN63_08535 [Flavisolibacter sp.]|nr:hypothetical protein [Flavisolibacter sp.]
MTTNILFNIFVFLIKDPNPLLPVNLAEEEQCILTGRYHPALTVDSGEANDAQISFKAPLPRELFYGWV